MKCTVSEGSIWSESAVQMNLTCEKDGKTCITADLCWISRYALLRTLFILMLSLYSV